MSIAQESSGGSIDTGGIGAWKALEETRRTVNPRVL